MWKYVDTWNLINKSMCIFRTFDGIPWDKMIKPTLTMDVNYAKWLNGYLANKIVAMNRRVAV